MTGSKTPTWEEIRSLIAKADQVCRESEFIRAHAERVMRRPTIWPDRRQAPRKHHRISDVAEPNVGTAIPGDEKDKS